MHLQLVYEAIDLVVTTQRQKIERPSLLSKTGPLSIIRSQANSNSAGRFVSTFASLSTDHWRHTGHWSDGAAAEAKTGCLPDAPTRSTHDFQVILSFSPYSSGLIDTMLSFICSTMCMCFLRSHNVSKSQGGALHFVSLFGHTRTAGVHIWSEEEVPYLPDAGAAQSRKTKRSATLRTTGNLT